MSEPIAPYSVMPRGAERTFPGFIDVGGSNGQIIKGLGIAGNIASDSQWDLIWKMPQTLPNGNANLLIIGTYNGTGDAVINPMWERSPAGVDFSDLALSGEGNTTLQWTAGQEGFTKELLIPLDINTIQGGDHVIMQLVFKTAGWTLTTKSIWQPLIRFIEP